MIVACACRSSSVKEVTSKLITAMDVTVLNLTAVSVHFSDLLFTPFIDPRCIMQCAHSSQALSDI